MTSTACKTRGCSASATHRVTVRDRVGDEYLTDVCDEHLAHHREVDRLLRHPAPLAATVETNHPDWRIARVEGIAS